MSFRVRQSPTEVKVIAALNTNKQLVLEDAAVEELISSFRGESLLRPGDPVILISAVGQPSTGKTGILDGVVSCLMSLPSAVEKATPTDLKFPQPKNNEQKMHKFDGITACHPPFIVECGKDGRQLGIVVLDIWNNSSMSEDVYVKMLDFCYHVSSLRIFSLADPSRPVRF